MSAENRDRMTIYRILVEQNKMPPGELRRVQAAFAKIQRDKARAGEWIQTENGKWAKK
ncbi:MAG: DUF1318 domain-containing protein [Candidatus Methylomirabilia bacterium]